jgi:hydroxyacylglutathione hydrolase
MFRRFFDDGLAQSSYLLASPATREAIVIDPRRDAAVYHDAARAQGLSIVYAIETHIHADFVSGARELAAAGVRTIAGPGAGLAFDHHEAADGEARSVGDLRLRFLHTPGHTPEHISILVEQPGAPVRVFTGDTLFVGAVGRPDLLGEDLMRRLAGDLYDSLHDKLLTLDGAVEVHPGHGAGSLCGAGIGNEPHSTIGQERRFNPMLRHRTREAFVAAVLNDLPDTPAYFPRMKRVNHDGPAVMDLVRGLPAVEPLAPARAAALAGDGALLLDLRNTEAFGSGHPAGAVNIAFGAKVGYWAGWVLPADADIVLLAATQEQADEATRQLLLVGLDRVRGRVDGGFDAWRAAGLPVARIAQLDVRDLRGRVRHGDRPAILDVRSRREWDERHIPGARHIPVGELTSRAAEIDAGLPVAVMCEGGFRSSLASSLLARAGFTNVVNVPGGMAGYRTLEAAEGQETRT